MDWKKIKKVSLMVLAMLAIDSCKNASKNELPEETSMEVDSSFWSFLEKWENDSLFQMEHIVFPLEGKYINPQINMGDSLMWQQAAWKIHKPFESLGTFKRSYSAFKGIVIESISDASQSFSMQRRFSKSNGKWYLIYYEAIHQN